MRVYRDDQKFLQFRINVLLWGIVAAFVFLAGSFWFVQGVQAEKYRGLSEANALRKIEIAAKRGLIMDRNGKILADNQPAYTLQIDRVVMKPLLKADKTRREKLIDFLSLVLEVPQPEVTARWEKESAKVSFSAPFPLAEDLSMAQVAKIQAQSIAFPEINVVPVQRRNYPYGTMAAHVLGFIGEVGRERPHAEQRPRTRGPHRQARRRADVRPLPSRQRRRGVLGVRRHGRRLSEYVPARKQPMPGDNIYLTLDFELQRRAEQYFIENELVGAAVALDPRNGEVLAMVSSPAFNPNVYSTRFTPDVYKTITSNPFKIELNRAIQGLYSPGIGLQSRHGHGRAFAKAWSTPSTDFNCSGSGVFFGRRFRC